MIKYPLILCILSACSLLLTGCGSTPTMSAYRPNAYYGSMDPSSEYNNYQPQAQTTSRYGTRDARGHGAGPQNFRTVIIDAGHGGKDSGAMVAGIKEKSLALDVAKRLGRELRGRFRVVFVRNGDYFVDLDQRVQITKPYSNAILVSIHLNHGRSSYLRGPETYYFRVDSYSLAKRLQRSMASVSPHESSRGLVRRRLRLTRNPEIPSVLVELGYLSNTSDRSLLNQSSYRQRMAQALAQAIKEQNAYGDAGMGSLPRPLNRPLSRPSDRGEL